MFRPSKQSAIHFTVLLVLAVSTGWFLVREAKKTGESFSEVGFIHVNVKKPVDDTDLLDTSKWKTYRNEEYGFELKYPEGWNIERYDQGIYIVPTVKEDVYSILKIEKKENISFKEFVDNYSKSDISNGIVLSRVLSTSTILIGDLEVNRMVGTTSHGINIEAVFIPQKESAIILSFNEDSRLIKRMKTIVETFKFVQKE